MHTRSTEIKRSYTPGGNVLQLKLVTRLQREKGEEKKIRRISLLVNSVYFFIETVFILETPDGYRLIAIHNNKLLLDNTYKTPGGAKIAFVKFFAYKAWEEGVKTNWTAFYPPLENCGPLFKYEKLVKSNG